MSFYAGRRGGGPRRSSATAAAMLRPFNRRCASLYICAVSLMVLLAFVGVPYFKRKRDGVAHLTTSAAAATATSQREASEIPAGTAVVVDEEIEADEIALSTGRQNAAKTTSSIPKPRAVLHVGPHKVASTYVQSRICEEDDLLDKLQFVNPTTKKARKQTACVALQLQKSDKIHRVNPTCPLDPIAELKRGLQASGDSNVILSSEEFDNLDDVGVGQLVELLQGYETTVVLYHRRKLGHVSSYYTQLNKFHRTPLSFTEFVWKSISPLDLEGGWSADHIVKVNGQGDTYHPSVRFNGLIYKKLVDLYGRHFGEENLVVFSYEGLKKAGVDPWEALVNDVLGYEGGDYKTPPDSATSKNVSPDPFALSVSAAYNDWKWSKVVLGENGDDGHKDVNQGDGSDDGAAAAGADDEGGGDEVGSAATADERANQPIEARYIRCALRQLKPLMDILPQSCSDFHSLFGLWESHEKQYFRSVSSRATFLYFYEDRNGDLEFPPPADKDSQVCEVDRARLVAETDAGARAQIATVFQQVSVGVERCFSGKGTPQKPNQKATATTSNENSGAIKKEKTVQ